VPQARPSYTGGVACQLSGGSWGPNSSASDFAFRTYVGLPIPTAPPPDSFAHQARDGRPLGVDPASDLCADGHPRRPVRGDASVTPPRCKRHGNCRARLRLGLRLLGLGRAMLLIVGVILVVLALAVGVVGFLLGRRPKAGLLRPVRRLPARRRTTTTIDAAGGLAV